MNRKIGLVCTMMCGVLLASLGGCPITPGPTDGNEPAESRLQVNFDAGGGNYCVAEDKDGNQYSFRVHEGAGGETIVTEANIRKPNGKELKLSLDPEGRPVNVRLSNNTAADLVYDGDNVNIRVTDATGNEIASAQGIKADTKKAAVQQRRAENFSKAAARSQGKSAKLDTLQRGLEICEEIIVSITDPETNPNSPLVDSELTEGCQDIADVASEGEVEEVEDRDELSEDVTIDEVPDEIKALAGQTYILFDAEGFCLEYTDVSNRLTFDNNGVLMTEFDRHLVFPDLNINEGTEYADPGITINYASLTELILTPDEIGFDLTVQPVFTGTQLDESGRITIERRFNAHLTFPVQLWGTATAEAHKLFDVAFINGALSEDGVLLELDLVLVDLEEANPVVKLGQLRYHRQGARQPERIYACNVDPQQQQQQDPERGIVCPGNAAVGEDFDVTFEPGSADLDDFQYDWFISSGAGYITGDPGAPVTSFVGTQAGFLKVTLLLHDMSANPQVVGVYECTINVGQEAPAPPAGLNGYCPIAAVAFEPFDCWVEGALLPDLAVLNWFVIGTWAYDVSNPVAPRTQITFYDVGTFQVVFEAWTKNDEYIYLWQDVEVSDDGEIDWGDEEPPPVDVTDYLGIFEGGLDVPADRAHDISLVIYEDGSVEGESYWPSVGLTFQLFGYLDNDNFIYFEDDGEPLGIYIGVWDDESAFVGEYYESDYSNYIGDWIAYYVE